MFHLTFVSAVVLLSTNVYPILLSITVDSIFFTTNYGVYFYVY